MQGFATLFTLAICHLAYLTSGYIRYPRHWHPPVEELPFSVVVDGMGQGFSLHWDTTDNVLYFADVIKQSLNRYDPATNTLKSITFDSPVSLVIPIKTQRRSMVLGLGKELVTLKWKWNTNNYTISHLYSADPHERPIIWGLGKADCEGRIWADAVVVGLMRQGISASARLYFLDTASACTINTVFNDTASNNGLAWSPDNKVLYYSSYTGEIQAFDFDNATGAISNPRTVFDYDNLPGTPSGLTVDQDGYLWIGSYNAPQIIQVNPDSGEIFKVISLPAREVTSLIFGGPTLQDLYVTTTAYNGSSSLMKISNLNTTGLAMYSVSLFCEPCAKVVADAGDGWCFSTNS